MSNPLDDALKGIGMKAQEHLTKQGRKQSTTTRRNVEYTTSNGGGDATIETSEDGTQYFVEIYLDDGYTGQKMVVSVSDGSRDGALRKAEEQFEENGSISLSWAPDDS